MKNNITQKNIEDIYLKMNMYDEHMFILQLVNSGSDQSRKGKAYIGLRELTTPPN